MSAFLHDLLDGNPLLLRSLAAMASSRTVKAFS